MFTALDKLRSAVMALAVSGFISCMVIVVLALVAMTIGTADDADMFWLAMKATAGMIASGVALGIAQGR